ncbi:MAG: LuxR C-terminal-related transcriptional regulator, partial [Candidatus Hodarchaeales archaeon]
EIDKDHPLRSILGTLHHSETTRIRLYTLSEAAVDTLMKNAGIKNDKLYERTGGNPFYVTEVLANRNEELPYSIKEAVIAHTSQLSSDAKESLDLISVIPSKVEHDLLRKLVDNVEEHIDAGINKAILITDNGLVSFRHELARLAILDSISEMKRIKLHQRVLNSLLEDNNHHSLLAQIEHHTSQAGDKAAVTKFAPLAAKQASFLDSHREAAVHYQTAIEYSDDLPVEKKLELFEGRYNECYLTAQFEEAMIACEVSQEILQELNEPLQLGENYRRLSNLFESLANPTKTEECIGRAVEILESLPPSPQLAMAYSTRSGIYAGDEKPHLAIEWGEKALKLARKLNEPQIEIHALANIGKAKMFIYDETGERDLKQSLAMAQQKGIDEGVLRAFVNLGLSNLARKNFESAQRYFTEGISYCIEKDLDINRLNMIGGMSKIILDQGNWDEASDKAEYVLEQEMVDPLDKRIAFAVIGIIRARRNDPEALINFDRALPSSDEMGECAFIAKMAKAEAYWLSNKLDQVIEEIESNNLHIMKSNNPWKMGELAFWLWKAGRLPEIPKNIAKPYLMQIKGDWRGAAYEWNKLGCHYQEALALSDGDEECKRKSLTILESLGATATINLLKQQMRESGIKKIPKGPRKSTKENPAGLTGRQMDVLRLLTKGLSNSEIADILFISSKTVDHHISAILSKLNLHSRTEAATFAQSSGMLQK